MFLPPPSAPWFMAGSALAGAIVIKTMDWWLSRRIARASDDLAVTQANSEAALTQSLKERISALEARQAVLEHRLAEEIQMRMSAIEQMARLRIRVMQLEALLRANGIDAPADPTDAERADAH